MPVYNEAESSFPRCSGKTGLLMKAAFFVQVILVFFGILKYTMHPLHEPDFWWHLAHGRWMIDHRVFLRVDIFSHTFHGAPWMNFEWLAQIIYALVYRGAGLAGLFYLKAGLGILAVALMALGARSAGARGPLLLLLTWFGYRVLQVRLCARVELWSLVFMALSVWVCLKTREWSKHKRAAFLSWAVGVLLAVWCNLHAGFVFGVAIFACGVLGSRLAGYERDAVRLFDRCFVFALSGTLLNPHGFRLIEVFLQLAADFRTDFPSFVEEWARPTLGAVPAFWAMGAAVCVVGAVALWRKERSFLFFAPMTSFFLFLGTRHIRTTALFAVVAVPFLAAFLHKFVGKRTERVLLLLCCVPAVLEARTLAGWTSIRYLEAEAFPVRACVFLKENRIQGRMYNPMGVGGFIGWSLGPERKVFADGRYLFYPLLVEEQRINSRPQQAFREDVWAKFLDRHGVDHAVLRLPNIPPMGAEDFERYRPLVSFMFPRREWALVYWDDVSMVVLSRKESRFAGIIREKEYKFVMPESPGRTVFLCRKNPAYKAGLKEELERRWNEVGATRLAAWLSKFLSRVT